MLFRSNDTATTEISTLWHTLSLHDALPIYAEGAGDREGSMSLDSEDLATLATLKASGVPVVVVLVSGRPMDVSAELSKWNALVAAWLPGTEGGGVADVLFGDFQPTGSLPSTWMQTASQQPINVGDGKTPLFAFGTTNRYPATQSPYSIIGASYYDEQRGTAVEKCADSGCGQNVGSLTPGDYVAYADVDFGATPPASLSARVASASTATGFLDFRLDSPTGQVVASVGTSGTGGWQTWASRTATVTAAATGVHRLYVVARAGSGSGDLTNLNWFRFDR